MRSGHLYQLFTYLMNAEASFGHAEGILLYPADGIAREYEETLRGHRVRIMTIDLARPWPDIRTALLAITEPTMAKVPSEIVNDMGLDLEP